MKLPDMFGQVTDYNFRFNQDYSRIILEVITDNKNNLQLMIDSDEAEVASRKLVQSGALWFEEGSTSFCLSVAAEEILKISRKILDSAIVLKISRNLKQQANL